jgi:hypothetical protein
LDGEAAMEAVWQYPLGSCNKSVRCHAGLTGERGGAERHAPIFWEMAIKAALGRADFRVAPERVVAAAQASGFVELPVRSAAALKVRALPHHYRDPFDRLLVTQPMTEPAVL